MRWTYGVREHRAAEPDGVALHVVRNHVHFDRLRLGESADRILPLLQAAVHFACIIANSLYAFYKRTSTNKKERKERGKKKEVMR